jgi:hypothetical protein
MFAYRIDDDLELRMLEERHAQELFEVIDRDREDLRTWLPWVDGSRSADDITAFIRSAGQELAALWAPSACASTPPTTPARSATGWRGRLAARAS